MLIREAGAEDWPRIWPFFREIVRAGETYAYDPAITEDGGRRLWMLKAPGRTVVAVGEDGEILGTATMGPNRAGRGSHVGTGSFMVDPAQAGRGVGRALGEEMIEWSRAAGFHAIQFNAVVETNAAAVALWESLGFETLTTIPEAFDHAELGLVGLKVMYLRL